MTELPELSHLTDDSRLGATYLGDGRTRFLVWAPRARRVEIHLTAPADRVVPMKRRSRGYYAATVDGVGPGARYLFRLDGATERPDPASRLQPDGVHLASEVIDRSFPWADQDWRGLPLRQYVIYELHVGTFTPAGTFDAVIGRLDDLLELGVTAIELMPVAQFPGGRNWGYDGVHPFAAQNTYGGPVALKRLVNACHQRGLAVILDVVYNHLGPEGNYLGEFGPYFTDRYLTPWGTAINLDGPQSDEVRRFFLENALGWLADYHVDALRLDAVHAIRDFSAQPFLEELAIAVDALAERLNRHLYLIAESDLNDARLIRPRNRGGYGLAAQWSDDFHHALHAILTGEDHSYYQDFGRIEHLARAWQDGYVYTGQFSTHRQRRHGNAPGSSAAEQFVVCSQNHDQIGNRAGGERLSQIVPFESLKLAAGAVLLSPFLPLLFMGEEYGELAPFLFFTSHLDPGLVEAVRQGRRQEFTALSETEVPDPQDVATFQKSKLNWSSREAGRHRVLLDFYRELLRLRRELPVLTQLDQVNQQVTSDDHKLTLGVRRWHQKDEIFLAFNFADAEARATVPADRWRTEIDSAESRWLGPGTSVPETLESDGQTQIRLAPRALVLLAKY